MSNITALPDKQDKMQAELEKLKRNLELVDQAAVAIAASRKRQFDAHIKAGFTAEQALTIVKGLF
jgi:hypothetical protein